MSARLPLTLTNDRDRASAVPPASEEGRLIDTFGRIHDNLRISVTDRCNLRCTYCMPEDVTFRPKDELLTFEEIAHFVRVAATLGVTKIRLTGGEPLVRRDLHKLVEQLVSIPGIRDVGVTTNGLLLQSQAAALFNGGLRRLNVSIDTLDEGRFRAITRRDGLNLVLDGLAAARKAGFSPIKINAVSMRGTTEFDVIPLARFARENGFELRFIEYMPIGADPWERDKVLPAQELIDTLEGEFGALVPVPNTDPRAPALEFAYADGGGHVGIIASVTRPFCHSCNRIRLTAEGKVRNCLFALDEADVRPLLREATDDAELARIIRYSVWQKWEGHQINSARFVKPERTMHAIGG
jgi:GTP 3',8-cyclase